MKDSIETRSSSLFTEISYDDGKEQVKNGDTLLYSSNGTLTVDMVNFGRYDYRDVPREVWLRFKKSASYGSFYNTYIKHSYQYTRLR